MTESGSKDNRGLTYKDSGVDITAGATAVELMKSHVKTTFRPEVVGGLGGFGGLFALNMAKYKNPVLVSGTDGVGTKLMIAFNTGRHDTIGIDAVAMCVNDVLVQGAEPLFFLDYLAVGKLTPEKVADIVKGIADGCRQAGCALIGGETAEMPGFYQEEEYDVAGFVVGAVDRDKIIDGSKIKCGDTLIGIPSSGLHSNGYSLARKVLLEVGGLSLDSYVEELGRTLGEELLEPTVIYARHVLPLIEKYEIKGMAHITGGGLTENIPRILPKDLNAVIYPETWKMKPIFNLIKKIGGIEEQEMFRTFNMGIGMVLIVPGDQAQNIVSDLSSIGEKALLIGEITEGKQIVEYRSGRFHNE